MRFEDELEKIEEALVDAKKTTELKAGPHERMVAVGTMFAQTRGIERRGYEKVGGGEGFGEVFEFGERERGGKKDFARSRRSCEEGGEEQREEGILEVSDTASESGGLLSRLGDFLGAVRYQYSYGLSDNGRIAANCVIAAFLFFILRRWMV